MKKMLHLWIVISLLLVIILSGCGGGGGSKSPPGNDTPPIQQISYFYALNASLARIFVYKINIASGSLETIGQVSTNPEPRCAVVHPDRNHLFVCTNETNTSNDYLEIYDINGNDGTLSLATSIKLQSPLHPGIMVFTPNGKYLCMTHPDAETVSIYSVNSTTHTIEQVTTINTVTEPKGLAIDPYGEFLYIAKNGTNTLNDNGEVLIYQISATGTVINKGSTSVGKQPTDMTLNHAGSQLYVTNFTSGSLMVFSVNATDGSLTLKNTYTGDAGDVRGLAVAPGDAFVFAGKTGLGLNAYSASGSSLSLITGSPFDNEEMVAFSLAVDPSGRFLYVARGYASEYARVDAYTIGASGELTLIDRFTSGGTWVTIR